jgi:drug/metabolite transporter (DMT)-like permease
MRPFAARATRWSPVPHHLCRGVTSGIVLLGEGLGVEKIVGGAIILFGVYLTRRQ